MARPKIKTNEVFAWFDANASVLSVNQLYDGAANEFDLTRDTARVYASKWRKSNGVQRRYDKRPTEPAEA